MNTFTKDMNIIAGLSDDPCQSDGLTGAQLQAKFDEGGLAVKQYLNETVAARINAEADYVVEQGTSGIWTYRKWNSGIAECWGMWSGDVTASNSSTSQGYFNGYEYKKYVDLLSGLFYEADHMSYTYNALVGSGFAISGYLSCTKSAVLIDAVSANSTGTQTLIAMINVKGRWKRGGDQNG